METELDKVVNSKKSHAMNYRVDGYDIEGKTGTAQVADEKSGGYVKGENPYFVSFIGDAPKKNPKVIVYAGMSLAQKNDQEAYEMGVSKAFKPIMENTLKYLNVGSKKDETKSAQYSKVPNVTGQSTDKAKESLKSEDLQATVIGNGDNVKSQSIKANKKLLPNSKVLLLTDGDITMPNMKGWTKDDVLAFQELTGINVTTKGSGYVTKQSVNNGTTLKDNSKVEIELSPKILTIHRRIRMTMRQHQMTLLIKIKLVLLQTIRKKTIRMILLALPNKNNRQTIVKILTSNYDLT